MKRLVLFIVFLLGLCIPALAQDPGVYRLQVDDRLVIQVLHEPEVNAIVTVGRDGYITAPFIGNVYALGKTVSDVEAELKKEYKTRLKIIDPVVSVTIQSFRELRATVVGAVNRPGTFTIRYGDSLINLLGQAGGVIIGENGQVQVNLRRATLRRNGSAELIPLDLYALLIKADMSQNYTIQDGDEIVVPEERDNLIYVMGTVQAPGPTVYREGIRLMDAIIAARGEIPGQTRFSKTVVLRKIKGRDGEVIRIQCDLTKYISKGDGTQNILLERGDVVYVPQTNTPDVNKIGNSVNVIFLLNQLLSGFFGFRLLGR
jgi:polysaccharide export outer membrane protein